MSRRQDQDEFFAEPRARIVEPQVKPEFSEQPVEAAEIRRARGDAYLLIGPPG